MGIIGSAIGGSLGIGASIFGGVSASKAMKKVKQNLEGRVKENQSWYDRRYNEDATQRADAQHILTLTNENIRQRNQNAAGAQAVMGGTDESVAAAKDQIEAQYRETNAELNDKLMNLEQAKAQNVAQAVQGVAQAGSNMASVI